MFRNTWRRGCCRSRFIKGRFEVGHFGSHGVSKDQLPAGLDTRSPSFCTTSQTNHWPSLISGRIFFVVASSLEIQSLHDAYSPGILYHRIALVTIAGSIRLHRSGPPIMELAARQENPYALYHYDPSIAAAAIFVLLFSATTTYHGWQAIRKRCGIATPLVVGGLSRFWSRWICSRSKAL